MVLWQKKTTFTKDSQGRKNKTFGDKIGFKSKFVFYAGQYYYLRLLKVSLLLQALWLIFYACSALACQDNVAENISSWTYLIMTCRCLKNLALLHCTLKYQKKIKYCYTKFQSKLVFLKKNCV